MIQLPNGCHAGKISVFPATWEHDADLSIEWYIHYRFHDPNFKEQYPKGYLKKVRGMNDLKTLRDRRLVTLGILKNIRADLLRGYNPILDRLIPPNELEISPLTGLSSALQQAFKLLPASISKD